MSASEDRVVEESAGRPTGADARREQEETRLGADAPAATRCVSEGAVEVKSSANPSDTAHSDEAGAPTRKDGESNADKATRPADVGVTTPASSPIDNAPTTDWGEMAVGGYWPETTA